MSGAASLSREPWLSHGAALEGVACAAGVGEAQRGAGGGRARGVGEHRGAPRGLGEGDVWFCLRLFV